MRQILIGTVLALSAFAAGCQTTPPRYQYSCSNYHAIDAGFCDDRDAGRLFGAVVGGAYQRPY
jgi:hypothetical protein